MSSETTSSYPPARPGFGRRLALAFGRFLKALLKVALVIAIIIAIGYGAYLIVQELQRSFQTVSGRVDYNLEQVQRIGHDLGALEQTVTAVQTAQDTRLTALETTVNTTLSDDLARQEEMLVALELQLSHLATQTITINEQIVSLNEGVVALQGDINENNGRLDELGGQLDTQANNSRELATQVTDLQTAVDALPLADIEQMRQVVTLFRVWEMVGRARLHLLERNAGLAANDTARALAALDAVAANPQTSPELLPQLALAQARLTLANAYLPENPELAALDLENGWRELDALLALLLGVVEPATAVPEATPETPTPAPTPGG
ncbi:MAG TPA: hypothetical protein PLD25_13880 [Chloroflexota bacterium]|nr:hypothetical protein [Chloroflexota bacterium]